MEIFNTVVTPLLIILDVVVKMATVGRDIVYVAVGSSVVIVLFTFAILIIRRKNRRIARL